VIDIDSETQWRSFWHNGLADDLWMSCAGLTRASILFVKMDCWVIGQRKRRRPSDDYARQRRAWLPIDAFDPCDDGFGAQLVDNSAEMLQVIDLEIDRELGEIRRAPAHADIVDIAVVLGDHGCHLGEAARLVDIVDHDPGRKGLRGASGGDFNLSLTARLFLAP